MLPLPDSPHHLYLALPQVPFLVLLLKLGFHWAQLGDCTVLVLEKWLLLIAVLEGRLVGVEGVGRRGEEVVVRLSVLE